MKAKIHVKLENGDAVALEGDLCYQPSFSFSGRSSFTLNLYALIPGSDIKELIVKPIHDEVASVKP
jgi:hypothetical protein